MSEVAESLENIPTPTAKGKYKAYSAYRDSGIEWLGEVPADWAVKRFKHHIDYQEGPGIMADDFMESGVPLLRIHNVQGSFVNLQDCNYLDPQKVRNRWNHFKLKRGNLLISCSASTGTLSEVTDESEGSIAYTGIIRIGPSDKTITKNFIKWIVSSEVFFTQIELLKTGTTIQHFGPAHLGKMFIPLPKINKQQSITHFLDSKTTQIDALIEKKQHLIELLKEKRTALISQAVTKGLDPNAKMKGSGVEWLGEVPEGWEVKAIKRESPVLRGASPRPIDDPKYFDEKGVYSWVRISDVTKSKMYLEETEQKLSELGSSLSVKLNPGSLFLSIAGSVGKPCITKIYCCIHDGFVYFPHWKGDNRFLYYLFASGEPYKGLGKLGTQLNLNTDTVGAICAGFPNRDEQQFIANFLDHETAKIDALIKKVEIAVEKLKEYRTALISAAVTGKIDLRKGVVE